MRNEDFEGLIKIRHALHQIAEVSEKEFNTAQYVLELLQYTEASDLISNFGGTGIAAVYDSGKPGKTLLFRAELDALPIHEINTFEYKSRNQGVSHKCGHDGHMTTLIGLGKKLQQELSLKRGKVILLFQPAEENGEGAKAVLQDEKFSSIQPDEVYAYHNLPGYPMGQLVLKKNNFNASVKSIIIKYLGKTAHAGEPEHGINPGPPISETLLEVLNYSNNDPSRKDFTLITPVHANFGDLAYGISAGYGELHLTIRTWDEEEMKRLTSNILTEIDQISSKYNIKTEISWTQEFSSNMNDSKILQKVIDAAAQISMETHLRSYPFKWGEDFGLFTKKYPGVMFGVGAGINCPALHNPDYDFPDEIMPRIIDLYATIIKQELG